MTQDDDRDPDHCTDLDCELAERLDEPELCVDCDTPLTEDEYPRCQECRDESDNEEYLRSYYYGTRL